MAGDAFCRQHEEGSDRLAFGHACHSSDQSMALGAIGQMLWLDIERGVSIAQFGTQGVDDSLDQAEVSLVFTGEINATTDQVFEVLADHQGWSDWFSPVRSVTNVGPSTGVGARRRVNVPPLSVDELFVVWDKPDRYMFTITASSLPVVTRMAEDWQLAETATGTLVTNTVAADLPRWARPFRSLCRPSDTLVTG